ncbi:MAG TPA: zinc ribbon domain-containing protein [Pyrinomonadaceae bacterium]
MSEIITAMTGDEQAQSTDHTFRRIVAGEIESVRARLVCALEALDYRVLGEQPLVAKRKGGASSCSFDVLRCVKSLTISLKALNPTSTLVTFDYEILSPVVTKGERQTIEREAEAIIALAAARPAATVCASCGTHNSDDSRFCRLCGTPSVMGEPAEMEVLRLTAGTRQAYQNINGALLAALAVAALAVPLILFSSKGPTKGFIVLIIGEFLALCWLIYGMSRLHRTLNPKKARQDSLDDVPRVISQKPMAALPPQPAHASVTEGTTELLLTSEREQVAVPVKSRKIDTAEIN